MTYSYCTLFDSLYLSRALAMYDSLKRSCNDFHLYIFPFDDTSKSMLETLNLSFVTIVSSVEFESKQLLAVKASRTKGEYCWTCTPYIISYCIDRFGLKHCTYIDADLYFFSNPNVLIDEMGGRSVLITEHRYTKRYDQSSASGIYCVQFITFRNDKDGLTALNWWKEKCLEWCFARVEDGKFGDQKYLDDWTERFKGVHVLEHLGGGVAPWNVQQYDIRKELENVRVNTLSHSATLIFYHFHYIKFYRNDLVDLGKYLLNKSVMENVYRPYLLKLLEIENILMDQFHYGRQIQQYFYRNRILTPLHRFARIVLGTYNVFTLSDIKNGVSH